MTLIASDWHKSKSWFLLRSHTSVDIESALLEHNQSPLDSRFSGLILHWCQWANLLSPNYIPFTQLTENNFYMKRFIGVKIWCSSKIFSVSDVNIVLFKVKVWVDFYVFSCPDPVEPNCKWTAMVAIIGLTFWIIKIRTGNAFLKLLTT